MLGSPVHLKQLDPERESLTALTKNTFLQQLFFIGHSFLLLCKFIKYSIFIDIHVLNIHINNSETYQYMHSKYPFTIIIFSWDPTLFHWYLFHPVSYTIMYLFKLFKHLNSITIFSPITIQQNLLDNHLNSSATLLSHFSLYSINFQFFHTHLTHWNYPFTTYCIWLP